MEIGAQIRRILDPHGEEENAVPGEVPVAGFRGRCQPEGRPHEHVGGDPVDQGSVMAERNGVVDDHQPVDHAFGDLSAIFPGLEGQHAGKIAHLAPGQLVLGMGGQAGVENPGHGRVRLQKAGQLQGIFLVGLYAQRIGGRPAQDQPGVEGREHAAVVHHRFFTSAGFAPDGVHGIFAAVSGGGIVFAFIGFRHAIDMAREARNPQTTVPIALILSLLICLVIYLVLQTAFIGALQPEKFDQGWKAVNFAHGLGPLAGVALALGIAWVTTTLYVGAILGPLGGALVATGSNARLGYALSQNKFFPDYFLALSSRSIPVRMLILNLFIGAIMVFFIPFNEVVSLNGAAITFSFCAGPIAVYALRRQLPDRPRRFKLPAVGVFANAGFLVATLIVYWSGWDTTWRLGLSLIVGGMVFVVAKLREGTSRQALDVRGAVWLVPYILGLGALSYLGDFSGGLGVIPLGWDIAAAAVLSISVFYFASWCRLPGERTEKYVSEYGVQLGEPASEETPI